MSRLLRPVAAVSLAWVVGLTAYSFVGGAPGGAGEAHAAGRGEKAWGVANYHLRELELTRSTVFYLRERYVEPERLDYERMFESALEGVERRVPGVMFRRDPSESALFVEVGEHREMLRVAPIASDHALLQALGDVADILERKLKPSDVPTRTDEPGENPYAEVEYELINGLLSTLDPHSRLLPPEAARDMDVENAGHFGGLGITIQDRKGKLTVEYPLKDTPAMEAGILADDHIIRINGESTINMALDEAVSRLRGKVGEPVTIEILREGESQPIVKTLVRAKIRLNPVEGQLLEGGVGYVQISSFHGEVATTLNEVLVALRKEAGAPLKGLVIDLRGNPGGFLNQAVAVSNTFLERGVIVSTVDGDGRKLDEQVAQAFDTQPNYPIAVLVDARSASASEIVAGALRNNGRAVIVGERTFGKGSVQNLQTFPDDSKLKVTTSKYLTPGDKSIQSVGIPADIELVPLVVDEREVGAREVPYALVHWRERVSREADLDQHLDNTVLEAEPPAWSAAYRRPLEVKRRRTAELDLSDDVEVSFARELLLASPSAARGDLLQAAGPLVASAQKRWEKEVIDQFRTIGVDWSAGPSRSSAKLDVRFDLGGERLVAGEERDIKLTVRNDGPEALYRVVAVAKSDVESIDGREFVIGKLQPGESRSWSHTVLLPHGYPSETASAQLDFRDGGNLQLATREVLLPMEGRPLPAFAWSWALVPDADGRIDVGDTVSVAFTLENVGEGASEAAFARLKNRSGRALDIVKGTLEPGTLRRADGSACEAPADGALPAEGCRLSLLPGEAWEGRFEVVVREARADGLEITLALGDGEAFDYATISRNSLWEWFGADEKITLPLGAVDPARVERKPPGIEISRAPEPVSRAAVVTLSGQVTDDLGLRHVMVYQGENKVLYEGQVGGNALTQVPFTLEVELEPGVNTLSVLAVDTDGARSTRSVVVRYQPEPEAAER